MELKVVELKEFGCLFHVGLSTIMKPTGELGASKQMHGNGSSDLGMIFSREMVLLRISIASYKSTGIDIKKFRIQYKSTKN